MKRARTSVRAAAMVAAAGLAAATQGQNTWTGGANTSDWHTGQNWSLGITPQPGHEVVIPSGFPGVSSLGAFVARLTAQSPLSVGTGGTSVTQNASLRDFSTTGGFICGGAASFSGNVSVQTSYTWRAAGGFLNTGTMNVAALPLSQTSLRNQGTINVSGGPLSVAPGSGGLVNDGTLELRSGGHLFSSGQFTNNATWRKVGATDSEVQCNVSHAAGTLSVEDGLLRLTGGGFYNAPMTIELGGRIRLEGPFVGLGHFFDTGAGISGAGELEIQGGGSGAVQILENTTVNLQGDDGLYMQSGGVMIAEGKYLKNMGNLRWEGGAFEGPGQLWNLGALRIPAGRSVPANDGAEIANSGTAQIDGALSLNEGSTFWNNGETILRGDIRAATPSSGLVQNRSRLRADPGPGNTSRIQPTFQQGRRQGAATTTVVSGTLSFLGGGSLSSGIYAEMIVEQGALLALDSGAYTADGAQLYVRTAPGSAVRIRGAGTVVNVRGGGGLYLEGEGSTYLESNAQLGGPGNIFNTTNFIWNSQLGVNGQAQFRNEFALGGGGSVLIPPGGARLRGTFTNTIGGRVLQQGALDLAAASVNNEGAWVVQPTSTNQLVLSGAGGLFRNYFAALLSAEAPPGAGRGVLITAALDNNGIVQAIGGITLTVAGQLAQLQNGVLTGGTWRTAEGGRIILPGVPPITELNGADVVGSQQGLPWLAGIRRINRAQLVADGDIQFTAPLRVDTDELEAPSVMRIGPGAEVTVPGGTTVGSPERTTGSYLENSRVDSFQPDPPRLITPTLTVYAALRPGGADAAGPFNLIGQLAMQSSGAIEVELGGLEPEAEHDQMAITGGANLAGTLDVKLLPGFVPPLGQVFTVLTATGPISGTFAQVVQPAGLPGNLRLEASYLPGAVTLTVVAACYANCDGSTGTAVLNVNDFVCFSQRFAAGDAYANCDGSTIAPVLNVNDFVCFQAAFAAGCR